MTSVEDPQLRAAVAADVPLLGPIEEAADRLFVEAGLGEFSGSISNEAAALGVAEGRITVAEVDGTVVGWVHVATIAGELSIDQISVDPNHQGRGIGWALMRHVMTRAEEGSIILDTQSDVSWNQPWYEKLGFAVVPEADWSEDMAKIAARQTAAGLDWQTRVFMRWRG